MKVKFPSVLNSGEIGVISGYITSKNSIPETIWDTTYLIAHQTVRLRYVPDSAILHNLGNTDGTLMKGEALLGDGVTTGSYDNMWGMVPGGSDYGGYLTFRIIAE